MGETSKDNGSVGGKSRGSGSEVSLVKEVIDTRCGYASCKPECLQKCAKPRFLLVCMCFFAVVEAYVQWGLVNIYLSTWERRYNLRSTQAAWIITSQDVASGILSPIFGYLATFYHKGHMVTAGAVCMCIGSFIFLIPQFAINTYELGGSVGEPTCDLSNPNMTMYDMCEKDVIESDLSNWLFLFCFAQVLFGYCSTSMWTVGITYIDDNVDRENTPLFLGIFNMLSAIGACLGFLGGGMFLELYVDIGRVDMDDIDIDSSDPRWVGAWWLGFLVSMVLAIPITLLMACFPKELEYAEKFRQQSKSQAHKGYGDKETAEEGFGRSCKDLGTSLKIIFGNPVFDLITIAAVFEVGGVAAFAAFLPKILQFQFGQTSSMAALVAGAVLIPGAALGQILGGIIPKAAKFKFRGTMWMLIISQFVCIICGMGFLAACTPPQIAGHHVPYPVNASSVSLDDGLNLIHECNAGCNCTTLEFQPICSESGISYFSPCHAACATEVEDEDGVKWYNNCSCIPDAVEWSMQAHQGMCEVDCTKFWIFMPLLLIIIIATMIENTGGYSVVMRVVPEKQKSFAFGVQTPIMRFLGNVPIPIIFGLVFDKSCEIWQDNCGSQGACWIYGQEMLAYGMFTACLIIKGISGTCFLIGVCIYKPPEESNDQDHIKEEIIDPDNYEIMAEKVNGEIVHYDTNNKDDSNKMNGYVKDQGHSLGFMNSTFEDDRGRSDTNRSAVSIENATRL